MVCMLVEVKHPIVVAKTLLEMFKAVLDQIIDLVFMCQPDDGRNVLELGLSGRRPNIVKVNRQRE